MFIFLYNLEASRPIVAGRIAKARKKDAKILVVYPRLTESARIADLWIKIKVVQSWSL